MRSKRPRRRSFKGLRPRSIHELREIESHYLRIGLKRGETSEEKVSLVLENWRKRGLILGYNQSPRRGYDDYIRHVDGCFSTLDGEAIDFQVKSSQRAAREHIETYPDIRVIVVSPGIGLEELNHQMEEIFKDKLPLKS